MHLDDWIIAKLLGYKDIRSVRYYRRISNQSMADDTREYRNYLSQIIDQAMIKEVELLQQQIRKLKAENETLKFRKALNRKELNIVKNL